MAPKTKGSPKSKANPKKQKKQELAEEQLQEEEQELAPAGEEDVEEYEEEGDVPAEEGPAGATRAKAGPGGSAATGAKRSAVSASTNGLPQARVGWVVLCGVWVRGVVGCVVERVPGGRGRAARCRPRAACLSGPANA